MFSGELIALFDDESFDEIKHERALVSDYIASSLFDLANMSYFVLL